MYVGTCPAYFCQAFKKNHTGVSTQVVMANIGKQVLFNDILTITHIIMYINQLKIRSVITGVCWRIKNNIIHLDIEQGEFLNEIGVVDDKTYWTEASHNENEIHYFDNNTLRHIVVNDINFSENIFIIGKFISSFKYINILTFILIFFFFFHLFIYKIQVLNLIFHWPMTA